LSSPGTILWPHEGINIRAAVAHERRAQKNCNENGSYVFPGWGYDNAFGGFPNQWNAIFKGSPLDGVTAHVLRHSFASVANDLGYTEITIAALIGHSKGTMTSKYVHTLDTTLMMAADAIAGYIAGLLNGVEFRRAAFALDRSSSQAALTRCLTEAQIGHAGQLSQPLAA
jgi:hypothetical protein